ncbi:MAG: hypothetical protein ACPGXZ_09720 [Saprospiraceae bacterium]
MTTEENEENYPLLVNRIVLKDTMIYVCQDYICKVPMKNLEEVKEIL